MTITYVWAVTKMDAINTSTLQDAVIQTFWEKTGTDENGNVGVFIGSTPFDAPLDNAGAFIPYDQLTEAIVLGWIQAVVVGNYEIHVDEQIANQIAQKAVINPPLPWAIPLATPVTS
jgi:hypothetical protein